MHIVQEVLLLFNFFHFFNIAVQDKIGAIEPNANFFKRNILNFKTFIYISKSKVIYILCICGGNTPHKVGEKSSSDVNFLTLVILERTPQYKQN